jgi:hypothetical protein
MLSLLFSFFLGVNGAWPPAPAVNAFPLLLCAGRNGPDASPAVFFLDGTVSAAAPLPPALTAFVFLSDDGDAWRNYDAALRSGLPLPSVPAPATLNWLLADTASFLSGGVPFPGSTVDLFASPWASHAVVYVTPLGAATPPSNTSLEAVARAAVGGALASRVTAEPPGCALTAALANSTLANSEQIISERLAALSPMPLPQTPSASRVPNALENLEMSAASPLTFAWGLALALATAALAAAVGM